MLEIIDLVLIFILMLLAGITFGVFLYYFIEYRQKLITEDGEDPFAKGFEELISGFGDVITNSLKDFKVDIDLNKVTEGITQQIYGLFLTVLGVNVEDEEAIQNFSFQTHIKEIIDSSVTTIVPETIKQFETLLPDFADRFIIGIQEALKTVIPEGAEGAVQQMAQGQGAAAMPNMDISKMLQIMFMQYIMKSMGGGGGLQNLLGGLGGGGAPTRTPSTGF